MTSLKQFHFPTETFMGGWFMPEKVCDDVIEFFNNNKDKWIEGAVGVDYRIDKDVKDSFDISISSKNGDEPFKTYRDYLDKIFKGYQVKYPETKKINRWDVTSRYNIQYYKPGGGFKQWHSERMAGENRVLVFMTYLNDVPDGGTAFKYQQLVVPAKKGLTLVWPTEWTHTHKGVVSETTEKYIITGWVGYLEHGL